LIAGPVGLGALSNVIVLSFHVVLTARMLSAGTADRAESTRPTYVSGLSAGAERK
jgi:hypothetical protein